MCLILISWRAVPDFPLVIAANRDEFHDRPTRVAHHWADAPDILGGRDLLQGGTWLAFDRRGRFAAVANYREPESRKTGSQSRGFLVSRFLRGAVPPEAYLGEVARQRRDYDPFNLVAGDHESLWFLDSREAAPRELKPGTYGISNGDLDCPWPKVIKGKTAMRRSLDFPLPDSRDREGERVREVAKSLFTMLADRSAPMDEQLPDTGIGLDWERKLAPVFVNAGEYGTRSSTVIIVDAGGGVEFEERSYDRMGAVARIASYELNIPFSPSGRGRGRGRAR